MPRPRPSLPDAVDHGFVRAPLPAIEALVCDPDRYATWWPGGGPGGVPLGAGAVRLRVEERRQGKGAILLVEGPPGGTLEWYLEPFGEGVIVHAILRPRLRDDRRGRRRLMRTRIAVRGAMVELKRRLEER